MIIEQLTTTLSFSVNLFKSRLDNHASAFLSFLVVVVVVVVVVMCVQG